jgi:hypothetical protein
MPKKVPANPARKRAAAADALSRARRIAERAKPNMRAAEALQLADEVTAKPDAAMPDIDIAQRKFGMAVQPATGGDQELHMVVMETKDATDDTAGRQRKVMLVDGQKVVGEQG